MQLISINIGKEQAIQNAKLSGTTGIYKSPVAEPVLVTVDGLSGDVIVDKQNHAGPDQAVYVYCSNDYTWWSGELGQELVPGTFGENLTISDLESAGLLIGDRLHIGQVVLEITSPRIPCVTLATRMGRPDFVKRFRAAGRPGMYCRVITPGFVQLSDPVRLQSYTGESLTLLEMFELFYNAQPSEAELRRSLAAPIAIRARQEDEVRLAKLLA